MSTASELKELKHKVSELEKVIELQAETISTYKDHIQSSITEMTRHFMGSVEPSIRKLVATEVDACLNRKKIKL